MKQLFKVTLFLEVADKKLVIDSVPREFRTEFRKGKYDLNDALFDIFGPIPDNDENGYQIYATEIADVTKTANAAQRPVTDAGKRAGGSAKAKKSATPARKGAKPAVKSAAKPRAKSAAKPQAKARAKGK